MTQKNSMKLIPALMLLAFAGAAGASGFAIQNQTGSGNGNAFSGAAAAAEDAGTIYFNPAGMTYLPMGHNITAVGTILARKIEYKDTGTFTRAGLVAPGGTTVFAPTGDGGDAGGVGLIPAGYWSYAYSQNLRFGIGVSPTFGNETDYEKNFRGFNSGFFAEMVQMNINPSIAYKVNDMVSVGAGISFAHNEITLKQGIPLTSPVPGFMPGGTYVKITGDDWTTGFNLGALFQLSPNTRIGLSYRSETRFDLEGKQKLSNSATLLGLLTPPVVNQDIKASLDMPANTSLVPAVANAGVAIAYDKSPVKAAVDRTMTLPDSDRTWLSFGAKYSLSKISSLDIGYSHIFFKDARTAKPVVSSTGVLLQTINGKWDNNSADLLSASYNHTF